MPNLYLMPENMPRAKAGELVELRKEQLSDHYQTQPGSSLVIGYWPKYEGEGHIAAIGTTFRARVDKVSPEEGAQVYLEKELDFPLLPAVDLVIALPRPQMLKRILELSQGYLVRNIYLIAAERGEKSYFSSNILNQSNIEKHLQEGARQAGISYRPGVTLVRNFYNLPQYLKMSGTENKEKKPAPMAFLAEITARESLLEIMDQKTWLFDRNNENTPEETFLYKPSYIISIGPERGWTTREKETFFKWGFSPFSICTGILKVEVAVSASLAQLRLITQIVKQ